MILMQKRCPWCGKKIKTHGVINAEQKNTPLRFIYAKCKFCGHYYGQNHLSSRVIASCLVMVSTTIFIVLWNTLFPLALSVILLLSMYILQSPLVRMDESEIVLSESKDFQKAKIISSSVNLKKGYIYLLTDDFDNHPAYSQISPIKIQKVDKQSKSVYFTLLYHHDQNIEIQSGKPFHVYDEGGKKAVLTCI